MSRQELIVKVAFCIDEEDMNYAQIVDLIVSNSPSNVTEADVEDVIYKAFEIVYEKYKDQFDPISIIYQHIEWYEKIYSYFQSIKHAAGMNKALQAKERLLNILKEGNKLSFKKSEIVVHKPSDSIPLDMSKLTPKEQVELQDLLNKIFME